MGPKVAGPEEPVFRKCCYHNTFRTHLLSDIGDHQAEAGRLTVNAKSDITLISGTAWTGTAGTVLQGNKEVARCNHQQGTWPLRGP